MIFWQLFSTFSFIGLFSFGGGYAMVSLVQKEVVVHHAWMSAQEFTNMIAIAEATPGPIAVNTATYAGFKVAGIGGAALANLGLLLPAFIIILALAIILKKNQDNPILEKILFGTRPIVVALIIGAAITLGISNIVDVKGILLCALALCLNLFTKINPVFIILGFGIFGIIMG